MNEFVSWCRHLLVSFLFHVVTSLHPPCFHFTICVKRFVARFLICSKKILLCPLRAGASEEEGRGLIDLSLKTRGKGRFNYIQCCWYVYS